MNSVIKAFAFLPLLIAIVTLSSFSEKYNNCQRFKNGTFIYYAQGPQVRFSYLISRKGSIQTETNQLTGNISKLALKWTSDCTYELRLIESTEHFSKAAEAIRKKSVLKTKIISSTDNYYIFQAERDRANFVLTDTLWIKSRCHSNSPIFNSKMPTKLTVLSNGSLRVEGDDFEIVDAQGQPYGLGGRQRLSICRCGLSAQKPFCDGSHKGNFEHPAVAFDLPAPKTV